jgi:hypothetical protein
VAENYLRGQKLTSQFFWRKFTLSFCKPNHFVSWGKKIYNDAQCSIMLAQLANTGNKLIPKAIWGNSPWIVNTVHFFLYQSSMLQNLSNVGLTNLWKKLSFFCHNQAEVGSKNKIKYPEWDRKKFVGPTWNISIKHIMKWS